MEAAGVVREWRHVFKLDPERDITDDALERICMSGTHAILVGGSSGVTFENTVELLSRIRRYTLPCVLEVSDQEAVVPGFDFYFIPMVLNSRDPDMIVGRQQQAIRTYGTRLPWEWIVPEGYVILNEESTAAAVTKANTSLDVHDVTAYAKLAETLMNLPIFYIEYSGKLGDLDLVRATKRELDRARLFYGGGIHDLASAQAALEAADTIVVGNALYEDLDAALETVRVLEE
ncbi:heptaprenylglyceryl phosphate synthase [Xylanibacillus composti]|uniref:Heptaprenylglyceryl phosphate synthase n=1 Tax=Xylanibacillus composti TaxID=1572762 RepID=A0A8J4M2M2_9BACL|nr:heptaprenylglyceryl phosphate synthase [Xylanibacillus composti]GIQ70020.1 heptaprenylglyceryl phosphate synthase [Xylanibacillus composti]